MDNPLNLFVGRTLAMDEGALTQTLEALKREDLTRMSAAAAMTESERRPQRVDGVGVLGIYGVMEHRSSFLSMLFGHASTSRLTAQLREMRLDPSVRSVLVHVDSPGGDVTGTQELAAEVEATAKVKPVIAHVDGQAASAAYWAIAYATEIVATPSGRVGSIGVFFVHLDESRLNDKIGLTVSVVQAGRHKTELGSHAPLADDARREMQRNVDQVYDRFIFALARGRDVLPGKVEATFGQGRLFSASDALSRKMIDRIATLPDTVYAVRNRAADRARASDQEWAGAVRARVDRAILRSDPEAMEARRRADLGLMTAVRDRATAEIQRTDAMIKHLGI